MSVINCENDDSHEVRRLFFWIDFGRWNLKAYLFVTIHNCNI